MVLLQRHSSLGVSLDEVSFEHVVHDDNAVTFFLDYLAQHDQAEALLFWLEVEQFKQLAGKSEQMLAQASKIQEVYFSQPETLGINDSSGYNYAQDSGRIQRLTKNKNASLDMFTAAQLTVQQILKEKFYPEFCSSSSFRALCDGLRSRRVIPLEQVLCDEDCVKYLDAFISDNMHKGHGNLAFLLEVRNKFRAGLQTKISKPKSSPVRVDSPTPESNNIWDPRLPNRRTFSKMFPRREDSYTLKEKKGSLIQYLHMAFDILDRYLSKGSKNDAKCVSDDSRRSVAQALEDIRYELSSNGGRLYKASGYVSNSKAVAVVNSLAKKLMIVFADGEEEVVTWLVQNVYPRFKESNYYVALAAELEELESALHRERNRLQSILLGVEQSDEMLVIQIPNKSLAKSQRPKQQVDFYVEMKTELVADCRRYEETVTESSALLKSVNRLLFDVKTVSCLELSKKQQQKSSEFAEDEMTDQDEEIRCVNGNNYQTEATSPVYIKHHQHTTNSDAVAVDQTSLPINLCTHAYPLGLQLRTVPPMPKRQTRAPQRVNSGQNYLVNVPRTVLSLDKQPEIDDNEEREYVEGLKPADEVHAFSLPCKAKNKYSRRKFWYGVCSTKYVLETFPCKPEHPKKQNHSDEVSVETAGEESGTQVNSKTSESDSKDDTEENKPTSEYVEFTVELNKHVEYGLGLNLYLDSHGFVCISNFPLCPDGTKGPAESCGKLQQDDAIVEINGRVVANQFFRDVVMQIKSSPNPVTIVFARGWETKVEACGSCGFLRCVPLRMYVAQSEIMLSRTPCFKLLRSSLKNRDSTTSDNHVTKDVENDALLAKVFSLMSRKNVASCVAALLLGRRCLMLSDDATTLTLFGEMLRSLLQPITWTHFYCPVLPMPHIDHLMTTELRHNKPFLVGLCTLDLGVVESELGTFEGFEDIKTWATVENDSLRPYDRLMRSRRLRNLVEHNTVVIDIDSDFVTCDTKVPAFPFQLQNQVERGWRRLSPMCSLQDIYYVLVENVYEVLLAKYREFYLTFKSDTGRALAFNMRKFLVSKPEGSKPFLRSFLHTRGFAHFLLCSLQTDADNFDSNAI